MTKLHGLRTSKTCAEINQTRFAQTVIYPFLTVLRSSKTTTLCNFRIFIYLNLLYTLIKALAIALIKMLIR